MSTSTWNGVNGGWSDSADWTGVAPNSSSAVADISAADGNQSTISDGEAESASMTDASAPLALEGMSLLTATGVFAGSGAFDLDSDYEGDGGGSLAIGAALTNNGSAPGGDGDMSAATTLGGLVNDSGGSFSVYGSPSDAATQPFSSSAGFTGDSGAVTLSDVGPLTLNSGFSGTLDLDADYSRGGSLTIGGGLTNSVSATVANTDLSAATTLTVGGPVNDGGAVTPSDAAPLTLNSGFANSGSTTLSGASALTVTGAPSNSAASNSPALDEAGGGGAPTNPRSAVLGVSAPSSATTVRQGGLVNDSGAGGTAQVTATDSSSGGGLIINATFGAGVPAGLVNAADVAIAFFETTFSANVTMNITFDWAPLGTSGSVASTLDAPYTYYSYSSVIGALTAVDGSIPADQGLAPPPANDPFPAGGLNESNELLLTNSQAAVLGFPSPDSSPTNTTVDATTTLNSDFSYSFYPGLGVGSDQFDAVGTLEHEISEVLGRQCGGNAVGSGFIAEPLALFRYTPSGQIDTTDDIGDYFSINGGVTDLLTDEQVSMGESMGDLADWNSSTVDCAGSGVRGIVQYFTPVDVQVMEALGWAPADSWQNSGSASWSTAGDWTLGVPTSSSDVDVAEGDPQVTAPFEVAALGITASVTFSSAGLSTVANDVITSGQMDFDTTSGAAGSGLSIGGYLGNQGDIIVGVSGGSLSAADQVKAATLNNAGVITLAGHSGAMAILDVVGSAVNNGTINIGQNGEAIFGGSLSAVGGSEEIELSSGGVLSLEDGTTGEVIADSGGTIDLAPAAAVDAALTISGASTVDVTSDGNILDGAISNGTGGAGALVVTGGGGLALERDDTYTGGTTVNDAVLAIIAGDNLGSGGLTLEGGAGFLLAGNFTLANAISVSGASDFATSTGDTVTISGVISNGGASTGGMAVSGAGTLVLAGANTFSNGTTVDSGATLSVSNNSALGSGAVTLDSSATLALTGSSLTLTGAFSQGAGSTTTIATGDSLTLSGGASLSGTTSGAGTLALDGGTTTIAGGSSVSVPIEFTAGETLELLGIASVKVSGSNGAITAVSGDTITLTGGTGDTITGTGFTVNASSGTGVMVGGNTATGPLDVVSGSNVTVGVETNSHVQVTGSNDTVTIASGAASVLVVNGSNDAITAASGDAVNLKTGTGDTITGTGFTVNASSGTGVTVGGNTKSGPLDVVDGSSATVGVETNSHADVTGSNDTVTMTAGAASVLVVNGSNDAISAASGDTINLKTGTGDTITGTGFTVNASSGTGVTVGGNTATGPLDTVNGSSATVGVETNSHADVTGSNDTVTIASGAASVLVVNGSNDAISAASGDTINLKTGTGDTITGTGFTVNASSGTGVTVGGNTASGPLDVVDGSSATVGVETNSHPEVTGSNDTVTMTAGAASVLVVNGSNDAITAASGDTINLKTGTGDTITGTGFTVNASSGTGATVGGNTETGPLDVVDGSSATVGVETNSHADVTGSNDTVTMTAGAASVLVVTGSNDAISAASGDTINLKTGTGDTITGTRFTVNAGSGVGLKIIGTADIVYVGLNDSITDGGSGSLFKIGGSVGSLTVSSFGADTASGVFDLLGGIGGYTTASQAYASLTSDGSGGSLLSLGVDGSLDIAAVAKSSLSAANFKIG